MYYKTPLGEKTLSVVRDPGVSAGEGQEMYCIKGKVSWYIVACPLLRGCPLARESVIRGFTVYMYMYM